MEVPGITGNASNNRGSTRDPVAPTTLNTGIKARYFAVRKDPAGGEETVIVELAAQKRVGDIINMAVERATIPVTRFDTQDHATTATNAVVDAINAALT